MVSGISLANKCQLLFGVAILLIVAGALTIPWIRTYSLVKESQWEVARQLSHAWLESHENLEQSIPPGEPPLPLLETIESLGEEPLLRVTLVEVSRVKPDDESGSFLASIVKQLQDESGKEEFMKEAVVDGKSVFQYARVLREPNVQLESVKSDSITDESDQSIATPASAAILLIERTSDFAEGQLLTGRIFIIAAGMLASLLAGIVFYLILTKLILSPVRNLRETTEKIQAGELQIRSQIKTGDEFEQLSDAFNSMLDRLHKGQTQLRALNESLDLKVSELSEANLGLYESNRLKSEFVASVSHELRTPLNSIIGFAELLKEIANSETNPDPKRDRYISNILTSGRSLLDMINELLDMAKIEAGRIEVSIEPTNVGDVIEGLIGIMRPQAETKRIELLSNVSQQTPVIETDPGKLQQILYNFLSNAIKFTPAEGTVTISADRVTRQNNSQGVRISVADTGPGIPYDLQDVIFEKFRQADASHTREHAGTGLGLAISRELAQMLGATVSFVSEPGRGATFFVDLPLIHQPEAPQPLIA